MLVAWFKIAFSSVVYKPRVQWLSFILLVRLSRPSVALGYSDPSLHVTSLELQHTAPLGGVVHGLLEVVGIPQDLLASVSNLLINPGKFFLYYLK